MLAFRIAVAATCVLAVSATKKNVLFFAVDDLRVQLGVDHVPGTPKMSTPNLDKLIGESLFLRSAQVQQAVCSPTRTSILTSRYPDTTRVWDLYSYFRKVGGNFTTIPQLFRENGYRTLGMGKIFHPGHASGQGGPYCKPGAAWCGDDYPFSWDGTYFHPPNLAYWSSKNVEPGCDGCGNSWIAVTPEQEAKMPLPDTQTKEYAIETLKNLSRDGFGTSDKPFFVAVGFHKPHLPFNSPAKFFDLYPQSEIELPGDQEPPKDMPPIAWSNWGELQAYVDIHALNNSGQPGELLPPTVVKDLRRAYYASVSYTDDNVGQVMSTLEQLGFADNTIVSFWGDHGWQLGEHGEWCKHTNFNLATNAPMFIRIPGLTDNGVMTTTPTEYLDLMPTLAEAAAGITVPPCPEGNTSGIQLCTHGTSLLPLITDNATAIRKAAYSQYPRGYVKPGQPAAMAFELAELQVSSTPGPSSCLENKCTMGYSLLTFVNGKEYRYTEWVDFNTVTFGKPNWARNVGTELYDHSVDPLENFNVASSADPSLLSELSALLRAHPTA